MQILDSLEYFAVTVDDAFGKLTQNIQSKQKELQGLSQRIKTVQQKNERVRNNPHKATSVYSLNKLPMKKVKDKRKPFVCTFGGKNIQRKPYNNTKEARQQNCENVNTVEVYNSVVGQNKRRHLGQEREGLGKLPRHTDTLTSCFIKNLNVKRLVVTPIKSRCPGQAYR